MNPQLFSFPIRIYYEDTDAGGIVYHARYLHFFERARTEYLRSKGFSQKILLERQIAFVVRSLTINYCQPAKLDDELVVETQISLVKGATLIFQQSLKRQQQILSEVNVKVACVNLAKMKAIAIPDEIKSVFLN